MVLNRAIYENPPGCLVNCFPGLAPGAGPRNLYFLTLPRRVVQLGLRTPTPGNGLSPSCVAWATGSASAGLSCPSGERGCRCRGENEKHGPCASLTEGLAHTVPPSLLTQSALPAKHPPFPPAALAKHDRTGGSNNRDFLSPSPGGWKPEIQAWAGLASPRRAHGHPPVLICVLIPSKDTSQGGRGPPCSLDLITYLGAFSPSTVTFRGPGG